MSIVTLDQAQAQLGIMTLPDAMATQLQDYVDGITGAVEKYKGEVIEARAITEEFELTGGGSFLLSSTPVISLTSVTAIGSDATWDVDNLHVNRTTGKVSVLSGSTPAGIVTVVYQAGYDEIPEQYVRGALVILQHVWETQRGVGGVGTGVLGPEETYDPRFSYSIPRKALEWLGAPLPGVA